MHHEDVSVANLPVVSLSKLQNAEPGEAVTLLKACQSHGFFYLDLQHAGTILEDWKALLQQMDKFFDQPLEVKMEDDCQSDTWGYVSAFSPSSQTGSVLNLDRYEPCGTSTGVHQGEPDGYESFKVARDEVISGGRIRKQFGLDNRALLTSFMDGAHAALLTICDRLSEALGLPEECRFARFHREDQPSLSTLAMFRYPKQSPDVRGSGHNKHTDLGSLTFLLSEQWGLQVLSPDAKSWTAVRPSSTHAIINVGDSLRFLSELQLKSAVHRVVQTEEMKTQNRYSVAYFLRAENDVQYAASTGEVVSAKAWHDAKFDVFRQTHAEQELQSMLTGGMERAEALVM